MKVAVISAPETQSGKSSFAITLGTLFSRTQEKAVAILSTEKMNDILLSVQTKAEKSVLSSVSVFEAVLTSGSLGMEEMFDYGIRLGDSSCYLFDVFDSNYDREQLNDMFIRTMNMLRTDLTIAEVHGDIHDNFNRHVLEEADVVLYLFTTSNQSLEELKKYKDNYTRNIVMKTGYVCSMYNPNVISEKKLSKLIGMNIKNILLFPYNTVIAREALAGKLDTVARFIASGHHELINLRPKLLEVMQYLFNTPTVKYILEVDKWHK